MTVKVHQNTIFGAPLQERLRRLERGEQQARVKAAHAAQKASSRSIRYMRPSNVPPRPGRSSTGGKLRTHVRWRPSPDASSVRLDMEHLNRAAPHWIIQEIGTGQRATIKRGGSRNPQGRARKGASYVRTVKSQRGRRITKGLAFGTGPGGQYVPPGLGRGQQLYPRRGLRGAGPFRNARSIVIQREIKGKHFVRDGAEEGFREYRRSVRAAAQSAFGGRSSR